jgi:hypothetical protein
MRSEALPFAKKLLALGAEVGFIDFDPSRKERGFFTELAFHFRISCAQRLTVFSRVGAAIL